jgi:hypothetical protein
MRLKAFVGTIIALSLVFTSPSQAFAPTFASGVTTSGPSADFGSVGYHVATLCVTISGATFSAGPQLQMKDSNGNYYNVGAAQATTGCTTVSEYAQSGASNALGEVMRLNWTITSGSFSYAVSLKN